MNHVGKLRNLTNIEEECGSAALLVVKVVEMSCGVMCAREREVGLDYAAALNK